MLDGRTDGQTDGVKPVYPPTTSLCEGYKNYSNLVNYSQQQKSNMATRCGHFVKVTSLEITRLLIHAHKYRKSHCGCKTILRSSYLPIMGFPILVRNIFIYIESGPWSDRLIETVTRDRDSLQCSTNSL